MNYALGKERALQSSKSDRLRTRLNKICYDYTFHFPESSKMSSFSGIFTSLPGIRCDNFTNRTCEEVGGGLNFFLSHCDMDHMVRDGENIITIHLILICTSTERAGHTRPVPQGFWRISVLLQGKSEYLAENVERLLATAEDTFCRQLRLCSKSSSGISSKMEKCFFLVLKFRVIQSGAKVGLDILETGAGDAGQYALIVTNKKGDSKV